jgi:hypothetical protein
MGEAVPQIIYTGPTDKRRGLRHNAIYQDDRLVPHIRALTDTNSALANLFVPLERQAKRRRQRVPGPVSNPAARKTLAPIRLGPPIKRK